MGTRRKKKRVKGLYRNDSEKARRERREREERLLAMPVATGVPADPRGLSKTFSDRARADLEAVRRGLERARAEREQG